MPGADTHDRCGVRVHRPRSVDRGDPRRRLPLLHRRPQTQRLESRLGGVARPGGGFRADITGRGDIAYGAYLEVEPPRRVVFSWQWQNAELADLYRASVVEVTLAPDGGGTLLRLVHRGVPPANRGGSAEGWTHYLSRLAVAATGNDPGPDPWATERNDSRKDVA